MSRSNKYGHFTLAILAASGFAIIFMLTWGFISERYARVHESYSRYQQSASTDRRKTADEIARTCEGMKTVAFADCIANRVEAYYRQQATNQDLQAQQDMALWGKWMFIASFAALFATVGGIWLVYLNLREARRVTAQSIKGTKAARKAVKVAKRQADLQEESFTRLERPYVLPGDITKIKRRSRRNSVSYNYVGITIGNYGRTPAIVRSIVDSFAPVPSGHSNDPETGVKKIPESFDWGSVLSAGDITDSPFHAILPAAVQIDAKGHPRISDGDKVFLILRIKFEDMAGTLRSARFTWLYDGVHRRFLRYGGRQYNYEREIDG